MNYILRLVTLVAALAAPVAHAAPFTPDSDAQIVEKLPYAAGDPEIKRLNLLRGQLRSQRDNLPLALALAGGYLELGRSTSDPRYSGYAEAALAPWQNADAPNEAVLMRAALRQRMHLFDAALADLTTVLKAEPRNAQAQLMRATVLQVVGDFAGAKAQCEAMRGVAKELVWTSCLASVEGVTGKLDEGYSMLRAALDKAAGAPPAMRAFVLTGLGEMAARADRAQEAEANFRAALAIDANDPYLLAAFADFLLDQSRPQEAAALVKDRPRADILLLRHALALQAQHAPEAAARVAELRDRFDASRLRGDRLHLREEARFTLHLLGQPEAALKLAAENWRAQKEPADIRILVECALASQDAEQMQVAAQWLKDTGMEDVQLGKIMPPPAKPK